MRATPPEVTSGYGFGTEHPSSLLSVETRNGGRVRRRDAVEIGCWIWAFGGAAIALAALFTVIGDAPVVLYIASVAFPLAAAAAAMAIRSQRDRLAGLLLLISVATPTYFAYIVNLPALVVGTALLAWPPAILGGRHRSSVESP